MGVSCKFSLKPTQWFISAKCPKHFPLEGPPVFRWFSQLETSMSQWRRADYHEFSTGVRCQSLLGWKSRGGLYLDLFMMFDDFVTSILGLDFWCRSCRFSYSSSTTGYWKHDMKSIRPSRSKGVLSRIQWSNTVKRWNNRWCAERKSARMGFRQTHNTQNWMATCDTYHVIKYRLIWLNSI